MKKINILMYRVIKLYLKNPLAFFFSFVYMLLFIVLIALFLGDYLANGMSSAYTSIEGINISSIKWLVISNSLAGVIMINCVLIPLNVLQIMVEDIDSNRLDSFLIQSPNKSNLVLGYWLTPFIIGSIMNVIGLVVIEIFITLLGGKPLSITSNLQMLGLIILNTFSATSILFVIAYIIKKATVYNTFTGLMSTVIGFLTGAFIPISIFPEWIQKVMIVVPANSGAILFRQIMTSDALESVFFNVDDQTIEGIKISSTELIRQYSLENGILYNFGNLNVSSSVMIAIIFLSGMLFIWFSVLLMKQYKNA